MDVVVEADPQLRRRLRQRHEGVPGAGALGGARPEAHVAFPDALSRPQFGRVVVQGDLRMFEHQQQLSLLGTGLGNPLVQRL